MKLLNEQQIKEARDYAEEHMKKYGTDKTHSIVGTLINASMFGTLVSFVLKGKKAKQEIAKKGYYLAYVVNFENRDCSELGEIYIDFAKNEEKTPYRVM